MAKTQKKIGKKNEAMVIEKLILINLLCDNISRQTSCNYDKRGLKVA